MSFTALAEATLTACRDAFGENVSYTPAGGSAGTVKAIFSAQSDEFDPSTGIIVRTKKPKLGVKLSDLAAIPARGDLVTVRTVTYKVTDVDLDGEGGAVLSLGKTS